LCSEIKPSFSLCSRSSAAATAVRLRLESLESGHLKHASQISQGTEAAANLQKDVNDLANAAVAIKVRLCVRVCQIP